MMTERLPLHLTQESDQPGHTPGTDHWPVHSGQADGQNSWETKFHKRVRQVEEMIGLLEDDHESLFGTLGSLIGPLEAPQNDQKPLKMAILGTFKHPSQT